MTSLTIKYMCRIAQRRRGLMYGDQKKKPLHYCQFLKTTHQSTVRKRHIPQTVYAYVIDLP